MGGAGQGTGDISSRDYLEYYLKKIVNLFRKTKYEAFLQDVNGDGVKEIFLNVNDTGGPVLYRGSDGIYRRINRKIK